MKYQQPPTTLMKVIRTRRCSEIARTLSQTTIRHSKCHLRRPHHSWSMTTHQQTTLRKGTKFRYLLTSPRKSRWTSVSRLQKQHRCKGATQTQCIRRSSAVVSFRALLRASRARLTGSSQGLCSRVNSVSIKPAPSLKYQKCSTTTSTIKSK